MTKERINEYVLRVSQANTSQLHVILQDIIIERLQESLTIYEDAGREAYAAYMKKTQQFMQELMAGLNIGSAVAKEVLSIYLYVNEKIIASYIQRQPVNTEQLISIMQRLRASFGTVSEQDSEEPIMKNTQQVYAGLTYGKGYLNESCDLSQMPNRGLKA